MMWTTIIIIYNSAYLHFDLLSIKIYLLHEWAHQDSFLNVLYFKIKDILFH